ncbi:MAG: EF-hand domain-containing protein [Candidatus Riflebacteria bacterium]|nr:EF-hand domain-containing protein [Candidatus Riflebacteria bacterium]
MNTFQKQCFLFSTCLAMIFSLGGSPLSAENQPGSSLYEVWIKVLKLPEKVDDAANFVETLLLNEAPYWSQTGPSFGQNENASVLLQNNSILASPTPWLCLTAIADYREALRRDFIRAVGRPDGYMDILRLRNLAQKGHLPGTTDADAYMQAHDLDHDGKLTIAEFVPFASQLPQLIDLNVLTNNFVHGIPYPTGQDPIASASRFGLSQMGANLFTTPTEIEQRVKSYASRIGGTTFRDTNGRLSVKDASGQPIFPLPPEIIPLQKMQADAILQDFVTKNGGHGQFSPNKAAVLYDKNGVIIPPEKWPPFTQPPYHPPQ